MLSFLKSIARRDLSGTLLHGDLERVISGLRDLAVSVVKSALEFVRDSIRSIYMPEISGGRPVLEVIDRQGVFRYDIVVVTDHLIFLFDARVRREGRAFLGHLHLVDIVPRVTV